LLDRFLLRYRDFVAWVVGMGHEELTSVVSEIVSLPGVGGIGDGGQRLGDSLLRLGIDAVTQRVNEAVLNAQATATAAGEADQERFLESLASIAGPLGDALGLSDAKPE
jgi:hypothetical protein